MARPSSPAPLAPFHPLVGDWFTRAFDEPTPAQVLGWPPIARGESTLICAPTGSGKTLAAFLWGISHIIEKKLEGSDAGRLVYVSPLKALNYDVERNLQVPLAGIADAAARQGIELPAISVAVRTGDTPARDRARMLKHPPDILITTPESLYLLLTSRGVEMLGGTQAVIVDEIHAVAASKRGAHLALTLERLERETESLQRIGLSATQRPMEEIARFLGGNDGGGAPRPVAIVDAGRTKELAIEVIVPVDDMSELGEVAGADDEANPAGGGPTRRSIWPAVYPRLLELIRAHHSTLVFVNNRRLAERLALRLNELAEEEVALAHHGSLARERRLVVEEELKAGRLRALVATSSLELGIDMGAIDLVVQVESPRSVARGLQRIGRAGHQLDAVSHGRFFPKFRGDLLECAAVVARMRTGDIEETHVPRLPLDVLAQQIVAATSGETLTVDQILRLTRGAYPFSTISQEQLDGLLDMLSGRYPSDEMADLRPRVVWDRVAGTVRGRDGARRLAVQNAGTIPDRGLFGVYLVDGGGRVGELDEEMVYEARTGQTFTLGASTWRIEEITRDRVIVSPAPGAPGAVPFWKGEDVGRPYELGRAVGRLARELAAARPAAARKRLRDESSFDALAAKNLVAYLADQQAATGLVPSDTAIVAERFRDEVGDWRLCILSPFGARVHAPWAMALQARLRDRGTTAQVIWSDDGIACHLPDSDHPPPGNIALIDADEVEELVIAELGSTALFGARFRENAARALLIPRRRPGQRTPLWQQRLKAQSLLEVTRRFGSFPIILETYRECLNDWFDMPALRDVLRRVATRELAMVEVETPSASPFAGSLLFEYVATYMYEDDTPPAERRVQALALDRDLLRELLGQEELRELVDPGALADLEADLQALSDRMKAPSPDGLHDILRRVGDLSEAEIAARCREDVDVEAALALLQRERRACRMRIAGEARVVAVEDAARYRDALGAVPPAGLPDALLEPVPQALRGLLARFARTHGPFLTDEAAERFGVPPQTVESELRGLEMAGSLVRGEIRPAGTAPEWCDAEVLRRIRRASIAALRREVEPVDAAAFARFLPAWHGIDRPRTSGASGADRVRDALAPLQGLALPAAQWEAEVFPRRLGSYSPAWLDELAAAGDVVWVGAGALGRGGGRVALYFRDEAPFLGPPTSGPAPESETAESLRAALGGGASFWSDLADAVDAPAADVFAALWSLVWAGEVTNDLWLPLRAPKSLPALRPASTPGRARGARRRRPAATAGRWSLAAPLFAPRGTAASPGDRARALSETLLERHGVLTRPACLADGVPGGFAAIYSHLTDLETLGRCRRGYFIDGLGGAQFALAGAVERLRDLRDGAPTGGGGETLVLGAADPAQPYGAALPWPPREGARNPSRVFGALVVLLDGYPVLYVERGGRSLITLRDPDPAWPAAAVTALADWVRSDSGHKLALARVDGGSVFESPLHPLLVDAGFRPGLRDLALRG